jgi:hypothetical protein
MPKRKRSQIGSAHHHPVSKLQQTFNKHIVIIVDALRSAAFPERQKLSRRLKDARDKNEVSQVERIGKEINTLKACPSNIYVD